jgi:hypothetical protein
VHRLAVIQQNHPQELTLFLNKCPLSDSAVGLNPFFNRIPNRLQNPFLTNRRTIRTRPSELKITSRLHSTNNNSFPTPTWASTPRRLMEKDCSIVRFNYFTRLMPNHWSGSTESPPNGAKPGVYQPDTHHRPLECLFKVRCLLFPVVQNGFKSI